LQIRFWVVDFLDDLVRKLAFCAIILGMANINPRGIDLTTGQSRFVASGDTIADTEGNQISAITKLDSGTGGTATTMVLTMGAGTINTILAHVRAVFLLALSTTRQVAVNVGVGTLYVNTAVTPLVGQSVVVVDFYTSVTGATGYVIGFGESMDGSTKHIAAARSGVLDLTGAVDVTCTITSGGASDDVVEGRLFLVHDTAI